MQDRRTTDAAPCRKLTWLFGPGELKIKPRPPELLFFASSIKEIPS